MVGSASSIVRRAMVLDLVLPIKAMVMDVVAIGAVYIHGRAVPLHDVSFALCYSVFIKGTKYCQSIMNARSASGTLC